MTPVAVSACLSLPEGTSGAPTPLLLLRGEEDGQFHDPARLEFPYSVRIYLRVAAFLTEAAFRIKPLSIRLFVGQKNT